MTDVPGGSGQMPRRAPRVSDGGAPVSGALAMVLAAIALIAGFFILRSISDGGETALDLPGVSSTPAGSGEDADAGTSSTVPIDTTTTTTTEPPLTVTGASVIVANANGISGSAGEMSRALRTVVGFTVVDPTNASGAVGQLDTSQILYSTDIAGSQAVAESLNIVLGGDLEVAALSGPAPVSDGDLRGAGVLLMLGNDKANRTLDELSGTTAGGATGNTNPPVAGDTTTTVPSG